MVIFQLDLSYVHFCPLLLLWALLQWIINIFYCWWKRSWCSLTFKLGWSEIEAERVDAGVNWAFLFVKISASTIFFGLINEFGIVIIACNSHGYVIQLKQLVATFVILDNRLQKITLRLYMRRIYIRITTLLTFLFNYGVVTLCLIIQSHF